MQYFAIFNMTNIHRGEIYLVDLTSSEGSEQKGIRPAVVVQNEIGNQHSPTTIVCPLTSQIKNLSVTHVSLTPKDCGVIKDSVVLCEQLRVIDKVRIKKKLGEINNLSKIIDINKKIMIAVGINI